MQLRDIWKKLIYKKAMKGIKYQIKAKVSSTYKIALLTDLHGRFNKSIIPLLQNKALDIIAVSGDFSDIPVCGNKNALGFLRACAGIAHTVLSLGNHDYLLDDDNFVNQDGYKILLDHHPENFECYTRKRDINLVLSGHNHGGQIRLFGKGVYARNQGIFPHYDGGLYENRLVISRGLANTMPIPRLFNPIEIVIVELIPIP